VRKRGKRDTWKEEGEGGRRREKEGEVEEVPIGPRFESEESAEPIQIPSLHCLLLPEEERSTRPLLLSSSCSSYLFFYGYFQLIGLKGFP